jgi:hypothetical protein
VSRAALSIAQILLDARLGDLRYVLSEEREPYDPFGAVGALFELLDSRDIDYVLVGGIAMLQYVEGRNTRDIDLIMSPADLAKMPEFEVTSRDADFARAVFQGVQVDLLLTTNKVFELVRTSHAEDREFAEQAVRCASPMGLFLMKCYALPSLYRQGDTARIDVYENDLRSLLRREDVDRERGLEALQLHLLDTDVRAVREIVQDISKSLDRGWPGPKN